MLYGILLMTAFIPVIGLGAKFSVQKTDFFVYILNIEIPYQIMSIFVMLKGVVRLRIKTDLTASPSVSTRASEGRFVHL
jgi:hypothetical protein